MGSGELALPKIDASARRAPPPMPKCSSKAGETTQGSTNRKVGQTKRFSLGLLESLRNPQQLNKAKTRPARASAGRHASLDALIASKNRLRKRNKPKHKKATEDPQMQIPDPIREQIQDESDGDNNSLSSWSVSQSIRTPLVRRDSSLETASPEVVSQLAEAEKELTEMDKTKAEEQQAAFRSSMADAHRAIMNLGLTRRETGGSSSTDSENSSS